MHPTHALAQALAGAARTLARVLAGESLSVALTPTGTRTLDAAVQDLSYATLRDYGLGDALLAHLLHKPIDDPLLRALLLASLRELRTGRAAPYAVTSQAVEAAGLAGLGRAKGLVNAVLRNYLRTAATLEQAVLQSESVRYRHPDWWITRLKRDHADAWQRILEAGNTHPPMTLRVNLRRITRDDYRGRLRAAGMEAGAIHADPAALLLTQPRPVGELPGFAEGLVSVQDAGAQRAATLLDLAPGQRVLDACAAPGGKSAHLLEMAAGARPAVDLDAARAARIDDTLSRLELAARVVTGDAGDPPAWWDGHPFDRILLDAPCSASGVVRRHPDIKWLRRAEDIARFARTQDRLLEALWRVLAPDGKMLYATCSVFREENAERIEAFGGRHPEARVLPVPGGGELLPDGEHDGFFYALLSKQS